MSSELPITGFYTQVKALLLTELAKTVGFTGTLERARRAEFDVFMLTDQRIKYGKNWDRYQCGYGLLQSKKLSATDLAVAARDIGLSEDTLTKIKLAGQDALKKIAASQIVAEADTEGQEQSDQEKESRERQLSNLYYACFAAGAGEDNVITFIEEFDSSVEELFM